MGQARQRVQSQTTKPDLIRVDDLSSTQQHNNKNLTNTRIYFSKGLGSFTINLLFIFLRRYRHLYCGWLVCGEQQTATIASV